MVNDVESGQETSLISDYADQTTVETLQTDTIQAFLSYDADQTKVETLQADIETWEGVDTVTYKSKDEALAEYRETMVSANAEDAVAALDGRNPIPASLVIRLTDPEMAQQVADQLSVDELFAEVCDNPESPSLSVQYCVETVDHDEQNGE